MNGKDLLNKMSDVDPKLIEDADKTPRHSRKWFVGITTGAATVAAAALIAVTIGNSTAQKPPVVDTSDPTSSAPVTSDIVSSGNTQEPSVVDLTPKDPPKLDFSKYKDLPKIAYSGVPNQGMGGGIFIGEKDGVKVEKETLNYSELEKGSPWKGAELETMPVYMSHSTDLDLDLDKMYALARKAAAALGIPEDSLKFTDTYETMEETLERHRQMARDHGATEEEIDEMIKTIIRGVMSQTYVEAENEDVTITVFSSFSTFVTFNGETGSIKLPDGYNFTPSATDEELAALVDYFADKYKGILNYSKPMLGKVNSSDRIYFYIYDSEGDLPQQIVNYWINSTCFEEHWENTGELSRFIVGTDDNCEKLGDYPILTPEQAEAILKSNKFDDKMRMPADAKILKTDMVYQNVSGSTGIIPYYEFYVETDEDPGNADVVCLVYTMPAVPEEFIDMDTGDYGAHA